MTTVEKQKTLPAKETFYTQNDTGIVGVKQYNCRCGWGHLNELIEETCQWTDKFNAVAIAMQIRNDVNVKEAKDGAVFVCWQGQDAKRKALISAVQQLVANDYWASKQWSESVETLLASPNCLSKFGSELYEKQLESETFKRYAFKKQIRESEALL